MHSLNYAYDLNSNIGSIENTLDTTRNQAFDYDALDRLKQADGSYGLLDYLYDPVGNRLTKSVVPDYMDVGDQSFAEGIRTEPVDLFSVAQAGTQETETYTYGTDSHRLLQRETVQYQYDAVGNTIHNGQYAFTYNQMNRLSTVQENGEQVAQYRYNALGQRTEKIVGTIDTTDYAALAEV